MKIGIITQPLRENYGALLQNYALQTILKRLGHEVITIDQPFEKFNPSLIRMIFSSILTLFLHLVGLGQNRTYPDFRKKAKIKYISKNTRSFIKKYICCSSVMLSYNRTRRYVIGNKLDALIVGSDQVWRPAYNIDIFHQYLDFAENLNIIRLAYAASFGVSEWEYSKGQTNRCKHLIKKFKAVSVREESGVQLCSNHLCVEALHVLDPTMLLSRNDYISIIEIENELPSTGDLFYYLLDNTPYKMEIIHEIAEKLHLTSFTAMPELFNLEEQGNLDKYVYPKITTWLRGFMDAKFIVCDSFHGLVFSIIFNKPFLLVDNGKRGSARFTSLLKEFSLENRLIKNIDEISRAYEPIDWESINIKIGALQKQSVEFLITNLTSECH